MNEYFYSLSLSYHAWRDDNLHIQYYYNSRKAKDYRGYIYYVASANIYKKLYAIEART